MKNDTSVVRIDGSQHAQEIRTHLSQCIGHYRTQGHPPPCLGIILVGDREDSKIYIRIKEKICREIGILSKTINLAETVTSSQVLSLIQKWNPFI